MTVTLTKLSYKNPHSAVFTKNYLNSLTGKLVWFSCVNTLIKPLLDPLYRLNFLIPDKPFTK